MTSISSPTSIKPLPLPAFWSYIRSNPHHPPAGPVGPVKTGKLCTRRPARTFYTRSTRLGRTGPFPEPSPHLPGRPEGRMRINAFLADQNVPFETLPHPPAYTAQKRAKYLHVSGSRVAKSVLLHGPDGFFLAVLPATHPIDTERLANALGGPVRLATGP